MCMWLVARLVRQERGVDRGQAIHVSLRHGPNVSRMSEPRHRPAAVASGAIALLAGRPARARRLRRRRRDRHGAGRDAGDGFDADRAFADLRAQVALGPRPSGSAANRSARGAARPASCGGPGSRDVRIQRPLAQRRRRDPGPRRRLRRPRRPPRHEGRASPASSAPTTAPRASPSSSSSPAPCRNPMPGPVGRDRALRRRGGPRRPRLRRRRAARQPPVRRLRPHRRPGEPADRPDRGDGAARHGRRLRPRDPARGELRRRPLRRSSPPPTRSVFDGTTGGDRRRPHPVPRGRDPGRRPDRLRVRPRRTARRVLAHRRGRPRRRLPGEPRRASAEPPSRRCRASAPAWFRSSLSVAVADQDSNGRSAARGADRRSPARGRRPRGRPARRRDRDRPDRRGRGRGGDRPGARERRGRARDRAADRRRPARRRGRGVDRPGAARGRRSGGRSTARSPTGSGRTSSPATRRRCWSSGSPRRPRCGSRSPRRASG